MMYSYKDNKGNTFITPIYAIAVCRAIYYQTYIVF